jgi:signal transduction histidine kinase
MQSLNDNFYVLIIIAMTGASLLVVLFILLQIRGQNKLLRQQKKLQEVELNHRKELLHAIILSQEKERSRIGMDLHDEVGTVLSSLRMTVENSHHKSTIDKVIANVRSIAHSLSPFTKGVYGLTDALEDLCDHVNQSEKVRVSLYYPSDGTLPLLHDSTALALYRVISECINNTLKHAHARSIELSLVPDGGYLVIDYKDDGIGLGADSGKGMGMRNIESRLEMIGAAFTMSDKGYKGFRLQIRTSIQ